MEQSNNNRQNFQRKMQTRHLIMLSLGGVIGTGLFLSSGYTISQAGPPRPHLSPPRTRVVAFPLILLRPGH